MSVETLPAVRESITVSADQALAFQVFADQVGSWWPREYSIGESDMADFVFEPRSGGRWYEVGVDGSECETGRVLAYEPPDRLVLAWHLTADWRYDPDPAHASEVEIRFLAESEDRTRVVIEHRNFERHGEAAEAIRSGVASRGGWGHCLAVFAERVAA
jgi:uncharacterized protein YndB with AHSA1/START domain